MIRAYAVVTPARDEAANLERLAASLAHQTVRPRAWMIVDNGSSDGTLDIAGQLAERHSWVHALTVPSDSLERGAPIVRALHAGIEALPVQPEILVTVDADVSMEPDHFERLLARFDADPWLGIASGSAFELRRDRWEQRFVTGSTVWGAARAYRWTCLQDLLPFEERMAWDGVDELRANALGWRTVAFEDISFSHHRREGERDGSRWRARQNQGEAAHYLGYRGWYLVLRAVWNGRREPAALGMIWGYAVAAARRAPRNPDEGARAYLRRQQSWRNLRLRALEASGRRSRGGAHEG